MYAIRSYYVKEIAITSEKTLIDLNFRETGNLLNTSWEKKKLLSNKISNDEINKIYELANKVGVYGGKLLGGGGGGYFLFLCPQDVITSYSIHYTKLYDSYWKPIGRPR